MIFMNGDECEHDGDTDGEWIDARERRNLRAHSSFKLWLVALGPR